MMEPYNYVNISLVEMNMKIIILYRPPDYKTCDFVERNAFKKLHLKKET